MSSTMLSQLRKFLKPFIEKVPEDGPRARFGHIQMPPYRFGAVSLMEFIRKEFVKGDCPNMKFFVVPDLEKDLGIGLDEDDTVRPLILKFSDILEALQATKEMALLGEEWAYRNANMELDGWQQHKLLPISIMLVLCLDPRMPSACALSLIGIVKWATAMSLDPDSDIRVLTMSAEKDFNFLSNVVSFTAPGVNVASLNLAAHGEVDPIQHCKVPMAGDLDAYAAGILDCMRKKPERRRLVISFNIHLFKQLDTKMTKDERKLLKSVLMDPAISVEPLVHLERFASGVKTFLLTIRGELSSLPLMLDGFDEIHIVPGSSDAMRPEWDEARRQVVVSAHPASREDRQLQRWWIRQDSIPERFIYPGQAPQKFLEAGGSRLRLVENAELCGFIAGVFDCASWGVDVDKAISCFVRQTLRIQEMLERLRIQRLLKSDGLSLSQDEAVTFRAVLPAFGFDHRLAMLVALDSGPLVRRVKVQLACMLKLGLIQKFNITNDGWKKPESYKQILEGCHGTGSSLANRGAMWLALGLIKHHIKNAELNDGYNKSQDHLKKLVTIRQQDASAFNTEVRNILRLISEKGISVDNSESITDEGDELSSHEQDELQTHLLRAFVYHLSVIQASGINARANLMNLSTLAKSKLVGLAKLTDVKSISDEGDFVYGVSHELALRGEDDVLSDGSWTSIPGTIVARWQSGFGRNMNIHEALSTGIRH